MPGERPPADLLDKYFEAFKHLATLGGAGLVLVLVIFRDSSNTIGILGTLICLSLSIVLSTIGMWGVVMIFRGPAPPLTEGALWWMLLLSVLGIATSPLAVGSSAAIRYLFF